MKVTRTSMLSGKSQTLEIPGLTQEMIDKYNDGHLLQDALRGIPAELREFFKTGITPEEWDRVFGSEEA